MKEQLYIKTKNANYYVDYGIYICKVNSDIILDLDMAKKLVAERKNLIQARDYPFLIIVRNYLLLDKQAFVYFASEEGMSGLSASSIVIRSSFKRILTNFNLLLTKQNRRFKVFNSAAEAKLWLFKYILENEEGF